MAPRITRFTAWTSNRSSAIVRPSCHGLGIARARLHEDHRVGERLRVPGRDEQAVRPTRRSPASSHVRHQGRAPHRHGLEDSARSALGVGGETQTWACARNGPRYSTTPSDCQFATSRAVTPVGLGSRGPRSWNRASGCKACTRREASMNSSIPNPTGVTARDVANWQSEGVVEYLGATQLQPCLAPALVCVLPSYAEGTPRAILEAMAMGRAALVAGRGWMPGDRRAGSERLARPGPGPAGARRRDDPSCNRARAISRPWGELSQHDGRGSSSFVNHVILRRRGARGGFLARLPSGGMLQNFPVTATARVLARNVLWNLVGSGGSPSWWPSSPSPTWCRASAARMGLGEASRSAGWWRATSASSTSDWGEA